MNEDSFDCSVEIIEIVIDDVRNHFFRKGFDYDKYDLYDNIDDAINELESWKEQLQEKK